MVREHCIIFRELSTTKNCLITTDFNCLDILIGETNYINNRALRIFLDVVADRFLYKVVMVPPRGSAILGFVLVSIEDTIEEVEIKIILD